MWVLTELSEAQIITDSTHAIVWVLTELSEAQIITDSTHAVRTGCVLWNCSYPVCCRCANVVQSCVALGLQTDVSLNAQELS